MLYGMGHVPGPDSGVVSDMARPSPDGAGVRGEGTERAWAKVGDTSLGAQVGVGSWAKRHLNRKEGQQGGQDRVGMSTSPLNSST